MAELKKVATGQVLVGSEIDPESTVEGEVLAEDPAVQLVEDAEEETDVEIEGTASEIYGEELPDEVRQSGIGVGFVSGDEFGASLGVAGEDDERHATRQQKSLAEGA